MIWAIKDNEKVTATPKEKAICPICNSEVIAKCGRIKVWHWAHKDNKDCDNWYEPESEWHKKWKDEFPKECQEFTMGRHRADIRTKNRWIIELQNSPISSEEIKDREEYYKRMIWLLNGKKFAKNLELREKNNIITFRWKFPPKSFWYSKKEIYLDMSEIIEIIEERLFKYENEEIKHFSPIYESYYSPIHDMDFESKVGMIEDTFHKKKYLKKVLNLFKKNKSIFLIKKLHPKCPCGGWGELITKGEFINKFK